ncbi:MAG TPA: hypothetical protein GXX28_08590 [Firmicutes bacterium]|nr:hypothetical protein [Bacillota bacterium]
MTTERFPAAQPGHPHITPVYGMRRRPCVYHWSGVSGTAREWAEDLGAVVAGLAFMVLAGAVLALVGR